MNLPAGKTLPGSVSNTTRFETIRFGGNRSGIEPKDSSWEDSFWKSPPGCTLLKAGPRRLPSEERFCSEV